MLDELVSAGATPKKIAIHFSSIAFSDIANYVHIDEGGAIHAIPLKQISKQKRFAIKKVKNHATIKETKEGDQVWKDSRIEYELYDKLEALKYISKVMGLEPAERQNHSVTVTVVRPGAVNKPLNSGLGERP